MSSSSASSDVFFQCVGQGSTVEEEKLVWTVDDKCTDRRTIINKQGLGLQVYEWYPRQYQQALGIVVLFHGIDVNSRFEFLRLRSMDFADDQSYIGGRREEDKHQRIDGLKYDRSLIANLNEAGFLCIASDMQGYGKSEGILADKRSYFEKFEDLIDDALLLIEDTTKRYTQQNIFLLGTSFGGLIVSLIATRIQANINSRIQGIILLAPALSLEKVKAEPMNSILLPIAAFLSITFPTLPVGQKAESPIPELSNAMIADASLDFDDPFCTGCYPGKLRARVGKQTLDTIDSLRTALLHQDASLLSSILFHRPLLLIHSKHDTMTDPQGSAFLADKIKSNQASADNTVHFLYTQDIPGCENMWHCLTQEPGCEALFLYLTSWLTSHSSSHHLR